jgi:hypothetical protein
MLAQKRLHVNGYIWYYIHMALEHPNQKSVVEYLQLSGHIVTHVWCGRAQNALTGSWIHGASPGTSDLITHTKDGAVLYIEMKSSKGIPNPEQIKFLREVHRLGLRWVIAQGIDDVKKALEDKDYHGLERCTKHILDTTKKFIPTQTKTKGRNTKMSFATMTEFDCWKNATCPGASETSASNVPF